MKEKCPVCRAGIKESSPVCRRCRSDLTTLLEINARAEALARAATKALAHGNPPAAADLARKSGFLRDTPYIRALQKFINTQIN